MIQNVLSRIGGIEAYGIISICLFFLVFAGVLVWACGLKKSYLNAMRELPLDGDQIAPTPLETTPETLPRHE